MNSKFLLVILLPVLFSTFTYAAKKTMLFEGRYEYRIDELMGEQVCFFPSEPSSKNVPRPVGDNRLAWFCFSNSKKAAHLLGFKLNSQANGCGIKGNAKIKVYDYKLYTEESEGSDMATLESVLKKTPPEFLSCTGNND